MAGHSQFKNIMYRKGAQDARRAKAFTKLIRELTTAARSGLPDPNANPRLRAAVIAARTANMPKDTIERAIKRGAGGADDANYEEMRYEGYGPGGVAIIHEYLDYTTWSFAPHLPAQQEFIKVVVDGWRASGGEPDIARSFPRLLPQTGFRIRSLRPIVDVVAPDNFVWQWPASFVTTYPAHLVETGQVDQAWADRVIAEFETAEKDPNTVMVTPMVLEIIAEKL